VPGVAGGAGRGGEQVGDLVAGQRDLPGWGWLAGVLGGGGDGEEGGGEHGQGHPPVPGGPAADLVLVQAGQALAGLEILFHGPAAPGDLHQGGQRDGVRGIAAVEGQFPGARGAADQQPAVPRAGVADADPGPVVVAVAFGACPGGQPLPGPAGQAGGEPVRADHLPGPGGHPVIARHRQHVTDPGVFQPGAQRPVVPVGLIRGGPGERDPGGDRPLDHPPGQLRLGREPHVSGDPGGLAAGRVTGPGPRQVQLAVDQRVPGRGRIAQVDRDLGVLDPPGRAGVLPLHRGSAGALLQVTGIVDHQHRIRVA
jgi:hypothetical protein